APVCLRSPRGAPQDNVPSAAEVAPIPHGTWVVLRRGAGAGRDSSPAVAILAVGTMVLPSLAAAEILNESGIGVTVVICRFLQPHDQDVLAEIVGDHRNILVVEEGTVVNGFGARMSAVIGALDSSVRVVAP